MNSFHRVVSSAVASVGFPADRLSPVVCEVYRLPDEPCLRFDVSMSLFLKKKKKKKKKKYFTIARSLGATAWRLVALDQSTEDDGTRR